MRVAAFCALLCAAATVSAQVRSISDPSAFHPYTAPAKPQPAKAQPSNTAQGAPAPAASQAVFDGELLTNDTVISLVRAGLGPETVVAKISATRGTYDTSTNALI